MILKPIEFIEKNTPYARGEVFAAKIKVDDVANLMQMYIDYLKKEEENERRKR
jgi:hypothetical protein